MLSLWEKILFTFILAATAAAFILPLVRRYRIVRAGQPDSRFEAIGKRVREALAKVLFQKCTLKNERRFTGLMHVFIFYGALTFDTMTVNHTLEGFFPDFYLFGKTSFGLFFSLIVDTFAVLVLAGVVFFAVRRFIIRPKAYATTPGDSALIYFLIVFATLSYLYFEAFAVAAHPDTSRLAFLGSRLAQEINASGLSAAGILAHFKISWWAHVLIVYGFIAYVPHSKYLHMITGPFNLLFRRSSPSGELKPLDLEKSESFGVERLSDFTWKDNLDAFACMECGRCQDACPAFRSDKPLSPKMILVNLEKRLLRDRMSLLQKKKEALSPLVPDTFSEGEIWTCTTCGACMHVCPVEIEHVPKIVGLRRSQVLMEGKFPSELNPFFRNIETNSNPWGIGFAKRADWAEGLKIRLARDASRVETLLWVGCMGSFDDEGKKISRAMVSILERANADFAVLGTEEKCCGDSARRLGHEYLFQTLAQQNLEAFKKYAVKKIITLCPHGFNTFRHEYPRVLDLAPGFSPEERERLRAIKVISHVELIHDLLREGKISVKPSETKSLVYHDSCYLGRHSGLIREPREILGRATAGRVLELEDSREHSFCCGAGGGLMWTEESLGRRVNHIRVEDIIQSGAQWAASSCPFCLTMLRDGLKDKERPDIKVKDIAQVVAEALA